MEQALKIIRESMQELGLNYAFMTCDPVDEYFTGEYQTVTTDTEDGYAEAQFILNGFYHTSWDALIADTTRIREYFDIPKQTIAENNSAVVIFYDNEIPIRFDEPNLYRMQINLTIKEWRVKR